MQDLNKFKNEMNLSGQNVYVGHRYVPKLDTEWTNTKSYESLTIVTYQGNSFTSRQNVPVGIDINNEEFWVSTGNYNAQVEQYRQDVVGVRNDLESQQELVNDNKTKIDNLKVINVLDFGAKGDSETDDRQAIQDAIDYASQNGGGKVYLPKGVYNLNSKNENHDALLVINHSNVKLIGEGEQISVLNATVEADAQLVIGTIQTVSTEIMRTTIEDITFKGNKLVNYNVKAVDKYIPFTNITRSLFDSAIEANLYLSPYLSTFNNVTTQDSKIGFHLQAESSSVITSITFNSCYANYQTVVGFKLTNLVYSSLNACACDNSKLGYEIFGRGVSLNGCGVEKCEKAINVTQFFGVNIDAFFAMDTGSLNSKEPTDYLIEFGFGTNATVSGVHIHETSKYYSYILGLTKATWGSENITVLDNSVKRNEAYSIANFNFTKPIKFLRGDETTKDLTIEIEPNELNDTLKRFSNMTVNHKITIKIKDGSQSNIAYANTIANIGGTGQIIIQGNSTNNEFVTITNTTKESQLKVNHVSPLIIFKDLTIKQVDANGYSIQASLNNSKNVIFSNVKFVTTSETGGAAIYAENNSSVKLIKGTTATGNYEFGSIYPGKFSYDESSSMVNGAKGSV